MRLGPVSMNSLPRPERELLPRLGGRTSLARQHDRSSPNFGKLRTTLERSMPVYSEMFHFYTATAERVLLGGLACTALEYVLPASNYSLKSRLRGISHWLIYIAASTLIWKLSSLFFTWLGVRPILSISFAALIHARNPVLLACMQVIAAIIVTMIGDFFYYWFHRLQHTVPVLWRFHAVHHSLREMGALNNNHHILEDLFRLPFVTLPLTLLQFDPGYVPAIALALIGVQPIFEHACTRVHLGPLRYVFGDPRFHRIHHSLERRHWHVNFGSFTTIWDSLFGTAFFPTKGEWPEVGLDDQMEPLTAREFVLQPFTRQKRIPEASKAAYLN
jgi:sterol desaturase/sphingolipid hydroxylase (fatty acid hydroxylase superfamily)